MTQHSALPCPPFHETDGLRDFPITYLVLGDPRALVLGRPVDLAREGLMEAQAGGMAARWWGPQHRTRPGRWHWQVLGVAGLIALAVGALLPLKALPVQSDLARGLPVGPATLAGAAVRVVATAYVAEPLAVPVGTPAESAALSSPYAGAQTPPLPFSPPSFIPGPAHAGTPLPAKVQAQAQAHAPVQLPAPSPRPAHRDEPLRPAVVLDEADARVTPTPAEDPAASLLPPVRVTQSAALARPAGSAVAARALSEPGRGLIAITPDNKLAVFTNPRTGLPQQFHVGDSLPGGDTIRAIDGDQGKVLTSAREYRLD
jgi:hypothetical protein